MKHSLLFLSRLLISSYLCLGLIYVDPNTWTLAYQNALAAATDEETNAPHESATSESPTTDQSTNKDLNDIILYGKDPAAEVNIPESDFMSAKDRAVLEMFYLGMQHAREMYEHSLADAAGNKEKALKDFFKHVDADIVIFDEHPAGSVEITLVDNKITVRVVYAATNENVVFVGSDMESTHMRRFISRLSMKRDTRINNLDADTHLLNSLDFKKPTNLKEWWQTYKTAIWKKPTSGHIRLALISGSLQFALTMGSGTIMWMTGVTDSVEPKVWLMSGLSFVLGTGLGSLVSTMKNWQLTYGNAFTQTLKRSSVSYLAKYLYYGLTYILITGEGVRAFFKPEAFSATGVHAHVASNTVFSNVVRTAWYSLPGLYEDLGKGREEVVIPWRGKKYAQGFSYGQLFFQGIYLIPFLLSKVDLVFRENIKLPFDLPFVGSEMEVGRAVLISGMFVAIAVNKLIFTIIHRRAIRKAAKTGDPRDIAFLKIVEKNIADRKEARTDLLIKIRKLPKTIIKGAIWPFKACMGLFQAS